MPVLARQSTSIFFGQQNTGRRTVGFGNHPELVPRAGTVSTQEPESVLQTELVFLDIFGGNFSPITIDMASKKFPRLLAGFFNRSQRTGVATTLPSVKRGFTPCFSPRVRPESAWRQRPLWRVAP